MLNKVCRSVLQLLCVHLFSITYAAIYIIGIVGAVATTGDTVNISDAYKDPRFNQAVDRKMNYVTRTILCTPVMDRRGNVVAVIQVRFDYT